MGGGNNAEGSVPESPQSGLGVGEQTLDRGPQIPVWGIGMEKV